MAEKKQQTETVAVGEFFSPFLRGNVMDLYSLPHGVGLTSRKFNLGERGTVEVHLVNQDREPPFLSVELHTSNSEGVTDLGCEIGINETILRAENQEPEEPVALYYSWSKPGGEPGDLHNEDYGSDRVVTLRNLKLRFVSI